MIKPVLEFKSLADGQIVAISDNRSAVVTDDSELREYFEKIKEATGGNCVEWNQTLATKVHNKVFYSYQPLDKSAIPADVLRCMAHESCIFPIIVTDKNACFISNGQNIVSEIIPCADDKVFSTLTEARIAYKEHIQAYIQDRLVTLRHERDEHFAAGRSLSKEIAALKDIASDK